MTSTKDAKAPPSAGPHGNNPFERLFLERRQQRSLAAAAAAAALPEDDVECIVIDGGLATHLETCYKCNLNHKLWSSKILESDPATVVKAQKDFVTAGAKMVVSCSYQATLEGFDGDAKRFEKAIADAAEASKASVEGSSAVVAGSCGSYGASLCNGEEYNGVYLSSEAVDGAAPADGTNGTATEDADGSESAELKIIPPPVEKIVDCTAATLAGLSVDPWFRFLRRWHLPRARALIKTGQVDLLGCETVPRAVEGLAFASALKQELKFPGYVSFACRSETELGSGERLEDMLNAMTSEGLLGLAEDQNPYLVGIGINCTSIKHVTGLVSIMKKHLDQHFPSVSGEESENVSMRPRILVYPNSGEIYDGKAKDWIADPSLAGKSFADFAVYWRAAGASIVGGCCRVYPKDIEEVVARFGGL